MSDPFLCHDPIDVDTLEGNRRQGEPGAVVSFQGVVRRDRTPRGEVAGLTYEAFEPLAESEMADILAELRARWPGADALARHRLGDVRVGETGLLLVVTAPSSAEAFQACHYALDQMKTRIPLWKKDRYADGSGEWSTQHRETMLISDSVLTIPQS
ncbi:MAG: molybdenum cofactor biosynthesis protein MoaE [Elusimicrobia bacterium]|nr:molybdenum cofactor biosynthesis protein MoaE [Elusimicrobiota bacterium]